LRRSASVARASCGKEALFQKRRDHLALSFRDPSRRTRTVDGGPARKTPRQRQNRRPKPPPRVSTRRRRPPSDAKRSENQPSDPRTALRKIPTRIKLTRQRRRLFGGQRQNRTRARRRKICGVGHPRKLRLQDGAAGRPRSHCLQSAGSAWTCLRCSARSNPSRDGPAIRRRIRASCWLCGFSRARGRWRVFAASISPIGGCAVEWA
jgi:hypothetical protein